MTEHPAKFSPQILTTIEELLELYAPRATTILDPFGGVGRVHQLPHRTFAVEIEPEWAKMSEELGPTRTCDFLAYHRGWFIDRSPDRDAKSVYSPERFGAVVTSPCYANRMADHHEAKDNTRRLTYRHLLGRMPSKNSSAVMQWGEEYRKFHKAAWQKARNLIVHDGLLVLNIKDHYRKDELQGVPEWHKETIEELNFQLVEQGKVDVSGMGFGAHQRAKKVDHEWVYVFRRQDA